MGIKRDERGMVIVEASIVFPVMFLVIFLMIFAGNAYLQKCRVDAFVNGFALDAAAYCADPMLDDIEAGSIPSLANLDVYPYRFFDANGVGDIESDIQSQLDSKIRGMSTGLFSNMKPSNILVNTKYNNAFLYSTFSIDVEYKIVMPIRLLGDSENISLDVATRADMPVADSAEFIRNIDMVEDYMEKFGVKEKITEMANKVKEWFGGGQ